jgi:hypothetical protein
MRDALGDLLDDLTLIRLALGIALGWSVFRVADGVALTVTTVLTDFGDGHSFTNEPLTWYVGHRMLTFGKLVQGLIALAVVLVAATLVERRRRRA